MTVTPDDLELMARALFVAERGRGTTSPNPIVGAVIAAGGVIVGQGAHLEAGGPHAEVVAIERAGELARGATLYCTLEPCSHTGRTGPCVERIVASGIRRVVVAVEDPNPAVSGRGLAFLRAHGIETEVGVGREAALSQHAPFFTWITTGRPFVTLKSVESADGFVGSGSGPVRLTGPEADRFFHRQRAEIDAIAVGADTVLVDNPLLTPRGAWRSRPLTRVVFDWRGRIPASARLFSTLSAGPVIMVVTTRTCEGKAPQLKEIGGRGVLVVPFDERAIGPVLRELGTRQVVSLLVEGGPALHAAFGQAGFVDRLQRVITPGVLGAGVKAAAISPRGWRAPSRRSRGAWGQIGSSNSMFTGLIEATGRVDALDVTADGGRLRVATSLGAGLAPGDSIAVNGVCLTATDCDDSGFAADIAPVTLAVTTLGSRRVGQLVNLERPLRADARMGGHFVLGHVDATGRIVEFRPEGDAHRLTIDVPADMAPLLVPKGSIAVDGISLTIAALEGTQVVLQIIPFTLEHTALSGAVAGDLVNLEGDVLGKYVRRMFETLGAVAPAPIGAVPS